jgi:hypothetical protein
VSTPYSVDRVQLAAAGNLIQVVGAGTNVSSFTVMSIPGGVVAFIRLGQSGAPIPIVNGLTWSYDPCVGPERDGLYVDLPGVAVGEIVLVVSKGGGQATI